MIVTHIIKATRISGAERHILMLLPGLRQQGVDARLLLLVEPGNPMDDMVAIAEEAGVPVERMQIHRDFSLLLINRLRGYLKAQQPDIVHTHLIHADTHGIIAARLAGVPTIITGRHNDDSFRTQGKIRFLNSLLWRFSTGGIAISRAIERFVIDVEHAPPEKVRVVEYGLTYETATPEQIEDARQRLRHELQLPPQAVILGMAARLTQQKGIPYALEAFAKVYRDYPQAYLVIAGDGELRPQLTQQTSDLGIRGRTLFLGWRADMIDVMAAYDVFVLPSLWEGFGLVLLEAMSRRLPIIASHVSAIPEVVADGETGLLVPPRDVDALADAMRTLLSDRTLRRHMGMVGEDRLETHFGHARMASATIQVYHEFSGQPADDET
ncbi:MAG: glycosyltransferase [Anaerolineaceae bacterium]|nr:glycosyltransferase [Anaerolineaceae bacterium]